MQTDVQGWPIAPERGRYIGFVYDKSTVNEGCLTRGGDNIELSSLYQWKKRVYQDELNEFNKHVYSWKTYSFGKVISIEGTQDLAKYLELNKK